LYYRRITGNYNGTPANGACHPQTSAGPTVSVTTPDRPSVIFSILVFIMYEE